MESSRKLIVAQLFRHIADKNYSEGNVNNAFFYYVHCLNLYPDWKNDLQQNFFISLSCWGQELETKGNFEEISRNYMEAFRIYPDSAELYNNLGAHYLRLNFASRSLDYFKHALMLDPNHFSAFRNLHSSYCALIERWHYRMLNDSLRNDMYRRAISLKISQGFDTVLDIGTGTGLFCLYAHWAGAKKIFACDLNETMISVASDVFQKNELTEKVKLIGKSSYDMSVPEDLPERVSLVVTETMDACMLGEQILYTLNNAWKWLLKPPYNFQPGEPVRNDNDCGIVIPHSGSLWFRLFQSPMVAKNYMFPLIDPFADDCARALANISFDDTADGENYKKLNISDIVLRARTTEPYDTERLQDFEDCVFLTDASELLHINFNDPEQIANYVCSKNRLMFEVSCVCDGYIHAIATWFNVHLDEKFSLTSAPDGPEAETCCWDQAVFPCPKAYRVFLGSRVTIACEWTEGKISLDVKQITHPTGNVESVENLPAPVSFDSVKIFNDGALITHLQNAAFGYLKRHRKQDLKIMDLYAVPIFGLTVLSNLLSTQQSLENVELVCVVQLASEEQEIVHLARQNCVPLSCISFVRVGDFDSAITERWKQYFDVILLNVLDSDGVLNEEAICRIGCLKSLLKSDGMLLPRNVVINGQLIYSEYLERSMRIINPDIEACGIGLLINEFQVPQVLDLNAACLKYDIYSNPFPCHAFALDNLSDKVAERHIVLATQNGTLNSILCWYSISFLNGFDYYSSLHNFSYVHSTAFLPVAPSVVKEGDNVSVDLVYQAGSYFVDVKRCDVDL